MKRTIIGAVILVIVLLAGVYIYNNPVTKSTTLAIGQQSFTFETPQPVRADLQEKFLRVIKQRVEAKGYTNVQSKFIEDTKFTLEFDVPEETPFVDTEFTTYMAQIPTFEIRLREDPKNLVLTDEEKTKLIEYNKSAKAKAEEILVKVLANPAAFADLAKQYSEDPGSKDKGGAYTGIKKGQFVPEYDKIIFGDLAVGKIYDKVVESSFGYHIIKKDAETGTGDKRLIDTSHILIIKRRAEDILASKQWLETGLVGMDIENTQVIKPSDTTFAVEIDLNKEGTAGLKAFTETNINKQMAVFVDGAGVAAPIIDKVIENGKIIITGKFTEQLAKSMVDRLSNGVLNLPIRVVK